MPADADFAAWLRLIETPGLGRASARRLLAALGSPDAVLGATEARRAAIVGPAVAAALREPPPDWPQRLAAALAWLAGEPNRSVLTLDHPDWPPLLLQSPDPPLLLYVEGDAKRLAAPALAIVGSRHATPQGIDHARRFGSAIGNAGWVVVSGLAAGIDAAAHEGALASAAGTVAVCGTGLDQVYPARHRALARRIAAHGALISEYSPGMEALAHNFPRRNRIIAGLTRGTLVVEAALKSGSLITARLAAEAGREVFAMPGSIHAPQSRGCHDLIKQGAKLVETVQDIFDELGAGGIGAAAVAPPAPAADTTDPLLQALGAESLTLDELQDRSGWPADRLAARLLDLELEGRLARLPGGRFQRRFAA
ncbi:MAG: DNA-processing protein DprA [Burkholderiales bacterium]|nr:DNA-processing protein DprA [Burkholderiales bacterium]